MACSHWLLYEAPQEASGTLELDVRYVTPQASGTLYIGLLWLAMQADVDKSKSKNESLLGASFIMKHKPHLPPGMGARMHGGPIAIGDAVTTAQHKVLSAFSKKKRRLSQHDIARSKGTRTRQG